MILKEKTKSTLESSIDSALLAVEIHNKPRTSFRVEGFITLMIIAWTRLFHAHFHQKEGDVYYDEKPDGNIMYWNLQTCINKHGKTSKPIEANLKLFIKLRNKVVHKFTEIGKMDIDLFGECQALLYNYEDTLIKFFGQEYAINESLSFSLQFAQLRKKSQLEANKRLLSSDVKNLKNFVETYRDSLSSDIFNSNEYSIKLIPVPKISNTNRNDLAIEFVNLNSMSESDKDKFSKSTALIKDKKVEAINSGKLKPSDVIEKVNSQIYFEIVHHDHMCLYWCFKVRPIKRDKEKPHITNTKYCHYDEVHRDYVFTDNWVNFIVNCIQNKKLKKAEWRRKFKNEERLDLRDYID